ncbi:RsmD family RNA methyltransferase [Candidatus Saccharibacteria bacterium]|nr:RsmD family RNA methyltransferase [Candidatus Saccharibacteria bacterium]
MYSTKITSGKYRGQTIATPGSGTHPMGSREKMALFNMISGYLPGATVLDAYAGSGALGIEALSRGANKVVFVEKNSRAAKVIRENLKKLGLTEMSLVTEADTKNFAPTDNFDVIIADPPYDNFEINGAKNLAKSLKNDGVFVLSHPDEVPEIEGLKLQKTHKYAAAYISIYTAA